MTISPIFPPYSPYFRQPCIVQIPQCLVPHRRPYVGWAGDREREHQVDCRPGPVVGSDDGVHVRSDDTGGDNRDGQGLHARILTVF